jgi:hypothetical protein
MYALQEALSSVNTTFSRHTTPKKWTILTVLQEVRLYPVEQTRGMYHSDSRVRHLGDLQSLACAAKVARQR